ncbi:transcription factor Adf-1-like [Erpetoichthys calabaricus]|uniref:Transcription factor Adf-1-like n=1 Tax=Erpetoichthys calabaricus TaxID=27687 RepID=A0A8C4TDT2_ERPCA|nr:transcription factor Adf-1-like [Erpetoichthys calabaricus]
MDKEKLITQVQSHPVLYDSKDENYKDNAKKDSAWRAVSTALGLSVEDCQKRWKNLRDTFVRKNKAYQPGGPDLRWQKQWKYAEIMSFLLPYVQTRGAMSKFIEDSKELVEKNITIPLNDVHEAEGEEESTGSTSDISHSQSRNDDSVQPHIRGRKRKREREDLDEKLIKFLTSPSQKVPVSSITPKPQSPTELFLMSLVPTIDALTPRNQVQAKIGILKLLDDLQSSQEEENVF